MPCIRLLICFLCFSSNPSRLFTKSKDQDNSYVFIYKIAKEFVYIYIYIYKILDTKSFNPSSHLLAVTTDYGRVIISGDKVILSLTYELDVT